VFRRRRGGGAHQAGSERRAAAGRHQVRDGETGPEFADDEYADDEYADDEFASGEADLDSELGLADEDYQDGDFAGGQDYPGAEDYPGDQGDPGAADYRAEPDAGASGPWDGAGSYPTRDRMDFGSLLVPARQGMDVQINMAEEQGVWVAVVRGDSALQLQAFAAPKTSGIWAEVREELADELARSGGESQQADGPFGMELRARVNQAQPGERRQQLQAVRFLGVDGPRWFLRGVISGPAARRPELARPFEELFADVVVVRGEHPAVPRELLEIRLPEEARKALEEQLGEEGQGAQFPNPFERGPEITETR
jgi:Protein of unknown function (DUF3710)